jgi:uncharacterized protein (DUF58 family)
VPEALRSLTTRGLALLSGGVATAIASLATGQGALTRLGLLAAIAPLAAAWWISLTRDHLTLERILSPQVLPAGATTAVGLVLHNHGRATSAAMLLEEQVPPEFGPRPRLVVDGFERGTSQHAHYLLRADIRGQFEIGPMILRRSDPFGLVELAQTFTVTNTLTVTPWVVPLDGHPVGGASTGSGDNRPRAFATGSAEDVTVRDYRRGDDLRRVHWRSSARTGELMVRREEQPWQSRATIFLDNRASSHRGHGPGSSLEAAVSAAASVAVHLTRLGYTVRLVTAGGDSHETQWHAQSAAASLAPLLEALALVRTTPDRLPDTRWLVEPSSGGLVVGIFGSVAGADSVFLRRLHHKADTAVGLVVDVHAWAIPAAPSNISDGLRTLNSTGWRVAPLHRGDRLDARWRSLVSGRATGSAS